MYLASFIISPTIRSIERQWVANYEWQKKTLKPLWRLLHRNLYIIFHCNRVLLHVIIFAWGKFAQFLSEEFSIERLPRI